MYTIETYLNDTFLLTNSLVVKITDTALAINKGLLVNYNIATPLDHREWKYYLNLNGEKHTYTDVYGDLQTTNAEVLVYVVELKTSVELTKDLLHDYPTLRKDLQSQGDTYKILINSYPNDIMYINGILFPVDPDIAYTAKDGSILAYNRSLVFDNELSIITELEIKIQLYLTRWYLKDYTITDELYLASMLATMYTTIANTILNIRLSKILTNEVHPFHLEHFFRSHLGLWDDIVNTLNDESIIWLYNNLLYLMKNTGKEKTFNMVVENIFSTNKLGIGTYELYKEDITVDGDKLTDVNDSAFALPNTKLITSKLNDYYINNDEIIHSVFDTVNLEVIHDVTIDTNIFRDDGEYFGEITSNELEYKNITNQNSKLLELETIYIYKFYGTDLAEIIIDTWVYNTFNSSYTAEVEYVDPNTGIIYLLAPKDAIYLLLKLLSAVAGTDLKLSYYNYNTILPQGVNKQDLIEYNDKTTISPEDNDYLINTLIKTLPTDTQNSYTTSAFYKYCKQVVDFFVKNNILMSNLNNATQVASMKALNNFIVERGSIDLTNGTNVAVSADDYLKDKNIDFKLTTSYDYNISIIELVKTFTGIKINVMGDIDILTNKYINILLKLTSYTTQLINNPNDGDYLFSKYNDINVNYASTGLVAVTDASIKYPLEPELIRQHDAGNNFDEQFKVTALFNKVYISDLTNVVNQTKLNPVGYADTFKDNSAGYGAFNNVVSTTE